MTTLDVMVVWSNQTQAAAGGGMPAFAQQCIDISNAVYANSGINPRLRLVYAGPIAYDESGQFGTDLNWLSRDATVAALRTQYGADFVAMIVECGQYCGLGWVGPNAGSMFTVINRGCAIGNYSFTHEIGHNCGALHNPETDPTPGYNHGYNPAALGIAGWRDVMSYAPGSRQAVLSNPRIQWNGIPAGTAELHDAARVINSNAAAIAAFRAEVPMAPPPVVTPPPIGAFANGSFESPVVNGYLYNPAGNVWAFSSGSGIAASGSAFTGSQPTPEGRQVAFLQGAGQLSQTFILAPGDYVVRFSAAQRQNFQQGAQIVRVLFDGALVEEYQPTTAYAIHITPTFTVADAPTHTLTFQGVGFGGDYTAFIDSVQIVPPVAVPAPSGSFTGTVPAGSSFRVVDGLVVGYP